jgi:large subunit ribosomal protein L30
LIELLEKRLHVKGNEKKVDAKLLNELTKIDSFEKFANELIEKKIKINKIEKIQPVFRLTPPSKGLKSVNQHYPSGDLGYRGKEINELLRRMI